MEEIRIFLQIPFITFIHVGKFFLNADWADQADLFNGLSCG